jgi:hypothetical protein
MIVRYPIITGLPGIFYRIGVGVFFRRCQDGENILKGGSLPGRQKRENYKTRKTTRNHGFILGLFKVEMINHAIKKAASSNKNENN